MYRHSEKMKLKELGRLCQRACERTCQHVLKRYGDCFTTKDIALIPGERNQDETAKSEFCGTKPD